MSLINDALKRATKAQASPPAPAPDQPLAAMQPVEGHRSVGLPPYFIPVLLIVFCGAFWFLIQGWEAKRQYGLYPAAITVQARELPREIPASLPGLGDAGSEIVELDPESAIPANRNFSLAENPIAATEPRPSAAPPVSEASAPAEPVYRLQGIFFRPSGPSAVVNAKTVYVGDLIAGGVVRSIDRQTVTIERNGVATVLTLQ